MTEFEKYFTGILNNKPKSCDKMKRAAEMLLNNWYCPNEFHLDFDIANKHINFIERFCKQPSGKLGTPLVLQPFQRARFQALFGFVDDNDLRQYNECLIMEGRKNGKTTEVASVENDMLVNDGEGSPQVYNIATMLDQAKLGFNACHKMIRQSPLLKKHIKKRAADLYFEYNMGFIKALASNSNSLDGLDVHCGVIDELAAIKNRDIYDLIKQAMGARRQPLLFCITTNGFVRNGIFDAQYEYARKLLYGELSEPNNRFLPFIYELDSPEEWDDESCWIKANPGIGTIKKVDYLRQMVRKAKDDPSFKATVMVKDFNVPQNSESGWLTWNELNNEQPIIDYPFRYFIGGFDAADSIDLNSAQAICKKPGDENLYIKSMYWLPQAVLDEEAAKGDRRGRDSVPYQLWKDQGLLRTCDGNKVNKRVILDWFLELRDQEDIYPLAIGYDPWHVSDELIQAFENEFGKGVLVPIRQGVITLSDPMKNLKSEFQRHTIIYNNNPIDKWCFLNTSVKIDVNGNIQPCKKSDRTQRIDGLAALLDAYVVYYNRQEEFESLI